MLYRPSMPEKMWDTTLFYWKGDFHIFYLAQGNIGHVSTRDFAAYRTYPSIYGFGGPGDWIDMDQAGNVSVNGQPLEEPYLEEKAYGEVTIDLPYQVPEDKVFVLGDHRSVSVDSRNAAIGCVSEDQIVGKIVFRVWPLGEFGTVK